jgi:hypothetical protein
VLGVGTDKLTVYVLDAYPVIVGEGPCAPCKGKGKRQVPQPASPVGSLRAGRMGDLEGRTSKGELTSCPECAGTGRRGETLTREHVVMSHDGVVRCWQHLANPWDSAYRRHMCEP